MAYREVFEDSLREIGANKNPESHLLKWNDVLVKLDRMFIGLNPTTTETIARDKKLTEVVLDFFGVPTINTSLLINYRVAKSMKKQRKIWPQVMQLVNDWGFPMVVKSIDGCGGAGVDVVRTRSELWASMHNHSQTVSYIVQPYCESEAKYRVIVGLSNDGDRLSRKVVHIIKSIPVEMLGDGISNVVNPLEDACAVRAQDLALDVAKLVGLNFGSVDVLLSPDGGMKVFEINTDVLTDIFDS